MSNFSGKRLILIVDDNQINRLILCRILSDEYDILQAGDGSKALQILSQYADSISAILLDLIMPVMNGYEFLDRQQANRQMSAVPVIVTTQRESTESELSALAHGASDFLSKPYNPALIKQRLANLIKLRETAAFANRICMDELTHLLNRESFYMHTEELLHNHPDIDYDILCTDVESFRLVNDAFGDDTGDRVLCCLAHTLKSCVSTGYVCRFSGDVFIAVLPRRTNYQTLTAIVDKKMKDCLVQAELKLKYGIYPIGDRSLPVRAMCDHARIACKSIKGKYGTQIAYYNRSLDLCLTEERRMTVEMGPALQNGEFVVYYQPKYELATERLSGAEALVRWQNPKRGFMPPDKFIPLFERNGFITQLDIFVWTTVCQELRKWIDSGHQPVPISANLSRVDIYNQNLPDIISSILERYHLPANLLHMEITETSYTDNPKQLIETVTKLKQRGFLIEMDDFGSGYSSLNMLNEVPVDTLKLDMRFMKYRTLGGNAGNILFFIMNLAKWLETTVVAEGIETRDQMLFLRSLGCNYGQGYYFAKPMPLKDFQALQINSSCVFPQSQKETDASEPVHDLLPISEVWNMGSIFNRVFNGFIGALALFEYQGNKLLLIRANAPFEKILGYSRAYVGESLTTILCVENPEHFEVELPLAMKTGQPLRENFYTIPMKDSIVHIQLQVISRNTHKTLVLASAQSNLLQQENDPAKQA